MQITLNGKPTDLEPNTTIAQFLTARELTGRLVVVEINGTIVDRAAFGSTIFQPGDVVEIVHFVGGGGG